MKLRRLQFDNGTCYVFRPENMPNHVSVVMTNVGDFGINGVMSRRRAEELRDKLTTLLEETD